MPVDSRDDQLEEVELDPLAGLKEDATQEQFEATLNRLRQVRDRAERGQLEANDYALVRAVIEAEMARR